MANKLYVGNIPFSTTEQDLQELFSQYGECTVSIITDPRTGRSKGFAFVEFTDESNAEKALEQNGKDMDSRELVVNFAKPKEETRRQKGNKLYVGNLSYDLDDGALREAFERFGDIKEASVVRFSDTGKSKGFGFVEYSDIESAERALELNGQELLGRKAVVRFAMPKTA